MSVREAFSVRSATERDAAQIAEIHNASAMTWEAGSFLLAPTDESAIRGEMSGTCFYVAVTADDRVAGCVSLHQGFEDKEGSPAAELLAQLDWNAPAWAQRLLSPEHWHLETLATGAGYRRRGVATLLYTYLIARFPTRTYSGFVVRKPFDNVGSVAFHSGLGFQPVAKYRQPYLGFPEFEADLFIRPPGGFSPADRPGGSPASPG